MAYRIYKTRWASNLRSYIISILLDGILEHLHSLNWKYSVQKFFNCYAIISGRMKITYGYFYSFFFCIFSLIFFKSKELHKKIFIVRFFKSFKYHKYRACTFHCLKSSFYSRLKLFIVKSFHWLAIPLSICRLVSIALAPYGSNTTEKLI